MIVTTAQLFKQAYGKYAVGAYNINNMEQALGLFQGHIEAQAPFIIQISKGARKYAGVLMIESIIRTAEKMYPDAIYAVHLDHGDEKTCYDCIDSGFYSSVMIDASHEPFDQNVATTKRVVERAHAKGLSVEAELGKLGGVEEDVKVDEKNAQLTDADEAKEFVKQTKCDSLAVAIGTSHGAYKFKGHQSLHFDRIEAIQKLLPGFPLVMHGSSSVPKKTSSSAHQRSASRRSTSIPTAGSYGRACTGNISATILQDSISANRARFSSKSTRSSSCISRRNSARPVSWPQCERQ
jgi:fructose-bisphosphate aldolase class II